MRFLKIIFVFSLIFFPMATSTAQSPAELARQIEVTKREREALLAEQQKILNELNSINKESQSLGTAVKSLDTTRKKLVNDLSITQSKIASSNLSIQALEGSIDDKTRKIRAHRSAISTAIQKLSEYDSQTLLYQFLANAEISEVWRDNVRLSELGGQLEQEISSLREAKDALAKEKVNKEATIEELEVFKSELSGQKNIVEENKKAKERLLAETKSKEASYQKMLADNLARQKQAEDDLFRLESELRISIDPSLYPSSRSGVLSWPLDYVYITQRFGVTSGSARLYASGSHNGVDFRASYGTPVKAVLGGVVEGAGNTDDQRGCYSYGRWILIRHPNGLSTIYAHLSASLVKKGETVRVGQVIGYSGGTPRTNGAGYSTGPHLHLGLFASQGVEVRQFTTSKNCKQVFVPIADTKAYLDPLAYLPSLP